MPVPGRCTCGSGRRRLRLPATWVWICRHEKELIASDKAEDEVRRFITATSLHHISLDALVKAIGFDRDDLCTGCLTGRYPLPIDGETANPREVDFVDGTFQSRVESFEAETT